MRGWLQVEGRAVSRREKHLSRRAAQPATSKKNKKKKGGKTTEDGRCVRMKDRDILKLWIV